MEAIYINSIGNIILINVHPFPYIKFGDVIPRIQYSLDDLRFYLLHWEYELIGYV